MTGKIVSFVFRAEFTQNTIGFYEILGVHFEHSLHEGGPVHFETPLIQGTVLEVYPLRTLPIFDTTQCSLVIEVDNLGSVVSDLVAKRFIPSPDSCRKTRFRDGISVKDPDGRTVIIYEKKAQI